MDERHCARAVGREGKAVSAGLDPTLGIALRAALSLLFVWAAGHKLRDVAAFRHALANYALLPARWIGPSVALLVAVEIAVAAGLWLPGLRVAAALAAGGLLVLYAGAISINLLRGRRDIGCGCAGAADDRPLGWGLAARNGVLVVAALAGALPATARVLTWVDDVTIAAGVAALALLYAAVDGLLANAPKIAVLHDRHMSGLVDPHGQEGAHA